MLLKCGESDDIILTIMDDYIQANTIRRTITLKRKKDFEDSVLYSLIRKIKDFFYDASVEFHELKKNLFGKKDKEPRVVKGGKDIRKTAFIISALIIPIINILVFWVYCNFESFVIAFEHFTPNGVEYDFSNFKYVFDELQNPSSKIVESIFNTLKYFALNMLVTIPISYLFAYFIYKKILGFKVYRYVFFLPSIVSAVIMTSFFKYMLQSDGPIAAILEMITGEKTLLLRSSDTALGVLMFYNIWAGFGSLLIYFISSLTRIPEEIIESAQLEGVGVWQEIVYLLFPLTWPTFSTFWILGIASIFSAGGPALLMTGGGYGTYDLGFWTYVQIASGSAQQLSFASALGILQTIVALPLSLFSRWLSNKVEQVEF